MNRFFAVCFFFLLLAGPLYTSAQTNQEIALALEYLEKGEYDKAVSFYEKFYRNQPEVKEYYKNYLVCLEALNDQKTAEKVIRKQVKDFPLELSYRIDLGQFYRKNNEPKKAQAEFDEALKIAPLSPGKIEELGSCFLLAGETDYAIQAYITGKKKIPGNFYSFNYRLAELYALKGQYTQMINELLEALNHDPGQVGAIENQLMTILDDNPESELNMMVKTTILREVQKAPDNIVYSELLIWLYIQHRQFESAFTQVKALDKRRNEHGKRLMELAVICRDNRKYDLAVKCYEAVIAKGEEAYNYVEARVALLKTLNYKITGSYAVTTEELLKLEQNYIETISYLGYNPLSSQLNIELSHLQAFYLGKAPEAMKRLEGMIDGARGSAQDLANAKMELADIMILTGEMWEPSLLYGQVEKEFKQDQLGQDAKFRNAKLSFYRGEFEWAQAQMKVLKASTSKLMSNDALALSLLILDNSGLDSSYDALMLFAHADLYAYQQRFDESLKTLDTLEQLFAGHVLIDEVLFKKAEILLKLDKVQDAAALLEKIVSEHGKDILGDDALFKLADLTERKFMDNEKAMNLYRQLITDYPGSLYVVEARKRFRQLRGDKIN